MIQQQTFSDSEKNAILARIPEVTRLLLNNLAQFPQHNIPLLKVGDIYNGLWLEHNQDNLFLADYAPENAWAAQEAMMACQRGDGLLPFNFSLTPKVPGTTIGLTNFGQVQSVWPFARCAFEIAKKTNRPTEDFQKIYDAGRRYDDWFAKFRNRAGTGLAEMFCEYDTGHDNDPRVTDGGIPRKCPGNDACNMPDIPCMPVLSVDLSAMLYGARTALADIAETLGRKDDAADWRMKADELAHAIDTFLYDPDDQFYYDRDSHGFRKYRTEHITRLFLNRVLTQERFDTIYSRYFTTPEKGFLPPFPFPSVAVDDPHFDYTCPKNSWGCNTQALTALRALLWMDFYHCSQDLDAMLSLWMRAFIKYDSRFPQEINPFTGEPVGTSGNYSPSLIIFLEAAKRLFA